MGEVAQLHALEQLALVWRDGVEVFILTIGERVSFSVLGTQTQFIETKQEFICQHLWCAGGSCCAPGIGTERSHRCLALWQTSC